jgi:hypothetical protein
VTARGRRRAAASAALLLLAGCEYAYGAEHRVRGPFVFEPAVLQDAVRVQHGARLVAAWDGHELMVTIARDGANVLVGFGPSPADATPELTVSSCWFNRVPGDAELAAAIVLQRELVATLARTVPGFPPPQAFVLAWIGDEAPLGADFAVVKARWQAVDRAR